MLKFKGWNTIKKEMYSAEQLAEDQLTLMTDGSGFINVSSTSTKLSTLCTHIIPIMVSEIPDKTGTMISYGDILTVPSIKDYSNCEVKFGFHNEETEYGWYVKWPDGSEGQLNSSWSTYGKIVGNIYQNPELKG